MNEDFLQHYPLDLDRLPRGWVWAFVGDVIADIQPGFPSGKHNSEGVGIPHLRPMNIDRVGRIDLADVKYVPTRDGVRLRAGDVIFNNTNSPVLIGKTASFDLPGEWAFSNHMTRLRPPQGVSHRFVAYQLHFFWMTGYFRHRCTHHVNQASMSSGTLARTVPIVLPPEPEQHRIVAAIEEQFSRIDAGVQVLERARRNLQRMGAAVLQAAVMGHLVAQDSQDEPTAAMLKRAMIDPLRDASFPPLPASWEWVRFGDLLLLLRNGIFVSRPTNEPGGIPILRISAVRPLRVDLEDVRYLPSRTSPKDLQPYFIANEDLLFTRYSGNPEFVGACAMVRRLLKPILHPDKLIRAVVNKEIGMPGFLEHAASAGYSRDYIRHHRRTTAGQTGISGGDLKNMPVPLPPLAEQARIAQEVDRQFSITFAVARAAEDSLRLSTSLRRKILDTSFRGSLVPQDPSDEPASVLLDRIRAADAAEKSIVRRSRRSSRR